MISSLLEVGVEGMLIQRHGQGSRLQEDPRLICESLIPSSLFMELSSNKAALHGAGWCRQIVKAARMT